MPVLCTSLVIATMFVTSGGVMHHSSTHFKCPPRPVMSIFSRNNPLPIIFWNKRIQKLDPPFNDWKHKLKMKSQIERDLG
jgi:hypothetical protein